MISTNELPDKTVAFNTEITLLETSVFKNLKLEIDHNHTVHILMQRAALGYALYDQKTFVKMATIHFLV